MATLGGKAASLFDARYRKCLVAGVGVVFLQQVTGQPSILYYANTIFKEAGMSSYAAVLTGVFKLFATLGSVVLVDKYGRRFLLFVGVSVMLVALIVMTVTFAGYETSDDDSGDDAVNLDWRTVTIIIGMFAYIGGYQLGFGPIAWLLISEVFPLEVRGQAVAFAVQNNFAWNLVVSLLYPVLIDSFGTALGDDYKYCAGFGIFAVLTLYGTPTCLHAPRGAFSRTLSRSLAAAPPRTTQARRTRDCLPPPRHASPRLALHRIASPHPLPTSITRQP